MPLPVIADVFRCSLIWDTVAGVTPVNVIHVQSATATASQVGTNLLQAFEDHSATLAAIATGYDLHEIDVLPLDGTSPTTPIFISDSGVNGSGGANPVPEVALVTTFSTNQRGARGRGRLFLGPMSEAAIVAGEIDTAAISLASVGAAWVAWNAQLLAGSPSITHVVASYVHADAHPVTLYTPRIDYGTQRRRLLQTRT